MSNICTPSPPFSVCSNGFELGETIPRATGRRNLDYQHFKPPPPPPPSPPPSPPPPPPAFSCYF